MNFEGKVSMVTGGSHGIGAATALCLARDGAHVAICARHEDEASREVTCAITALGRHAHFSAADMGRPEDVLRCVEETRRALGDPDIVVHSAGAAAAGLSAACSTIGSARAVSTLPSRGFHHRNSNAGIVKSPGRSTM